MSYKRASPACKVVEQIHFLSQDNEKMANVVYLDDLLNLCKAMNSKDTNKQEVALQEEYDSLMAMECENSSFLQKNTLAYDTNRCFIPRRMHQAKSFVTRCSWWQNGKIKWPE